MQMRSSYLHACGPTLMSVSVNKKGGCKMKEKEVKEMTNVRKNKMIVTKNQKEEKEMIDMEERKEIENKKGVEEMEVKELVKEIETKKLLLAEKVVKWAQTLCPIRDIHVKIKGRYYPLLGKETGKIYLIDKVQSRKIPFNTLDQNMKFVIASILAERKEEIEKEVEEDKKKYLEKKLNEIENLLNKF